MKQLKLCLSAMPLIVITLVALTTVHGSAAGRSTADSTLASDVGQFEAKGVYDLIVSLGDGGEDRKDIAAKRHRCR